jgi:hypothetical protein
MENNETIDVMNRWYQNRCQPLEVHRGRRQIGLNFHISEAAPHGARQPMPGFRLAMEALGAPAMALVNPAILRSPFLAMAASTKQGRIIVSHDDGLVNPPLR